MLINPHTFSYTSFLENETTLRALTRQEVGQFVDSSLIPCDQEMVMPFIFRAGELYLDIQHYNHLTFPSDDWQTFQIMEQLPAFNAVILCHGPIELLTTPPLIEEIQFLFGEKFPNQSNQQSCHTYALLSCKQIIGYMN